MDETDQLAAAILAYGHMREDHFDAEVATDGTFVILLTLYRARAEIGGVTLEKAIEAVDDRLSAAVLSLDRLVTRGHVGCVGASSQRRFSLSVAAERMVNRYLTACLAMRTIVQSRFAPG